LTPGFGQPRSCRLGPHLQYNHAELLAPGRFIDSNARSIVELAHSVTAGLRGEIDRIVRLYRAVRDGIIYDPSVDLFDQQNYSRE
jgi:transglutaminase-like putative cysteine protease